MMAKPSTKERTTYWYGNGIGSWALMSFSRYACGEKALSLQRVGRYRRPGQNSGLVFHLVGQVNTIGMSWLCVKLWTAASWSAYPAKRTFSGGWALAHQQHPLHPRRCLLQTHRRPRSHQCLLRTRHCRRHPRLCPPRIRRCRQRRRHCRNQPPWNIESLHSWIGLDDCVCLERFSRLL